MIVVATLALTVFTGTAQGQCVEYGEKGSSPIYRLCPNGVVYEKSVLYYGFWTAWERLHWNIKPPCDWVAKDSTWRCGNRIISCAANGCK